MKLGLKALVYAILYSSLAYTSIRFAYQRFLGIVIVSIYGSMIVIALSLSWSSDAMGVVCGLFGVFVVTALLARRAQYTRLNLRCR